MKNDAGPWETGADAAIIGTIIVSIGADIASIGTNIATIGTNHANIGTNIASIGTNITAIGTNHVAIGTDIATIGTDPGTIGTDREVIGGDSSALGVKFTSPPADPEGRGAGAEEPATLELLNPGTLELAGAYQDALRGFVPSCLIRIQEEIDRG